MTETRTPAADVEIGDEVRCGPPHARRWYAVTATATRNGQTSLDLANGQRLTVPAGSSLTVRYED